MKEERQEARAEAKATSLAVVEAEQEQEQEEEEEEEEAPVLFNRELPNLLAVLEKADVIMEVLDARDPLAFRSKHIEDIAVEKGKKLLFVMNKIGEFFYLWFVFVVFMLNRLLNRSMS